jgi:TRAP-type C4-dicarboxylate transport system permease small subunit
MSVHEPASRERAGARREGRFEAAFVRANQALIVAMMAVMIALVFTNVVCRYVLNFSIVWAEELSQYLMVWIAFLGAGLAMREGRHVAVEMLQDLLPARAAHATRIVVGALVIVFLVVLTVLGFRFAWFAREQETPVMTIPLAIPYLAVPLGALVFAAHFALMFREYVAKRFEAPESLEAEVPLDGV